MYLLGEITRPGLYELKKSRTVLDAISAAGSWTSKTAKKRIYLIRKGKDEEPIKINLKKCLKLAIWNKTTSLMRETCTTSKAMASCFNSGG